MAIAERTLRVRLGIKRTSDLQVVLPQFAAGVPTLQRAEPIPISPLAADNIFRFDHTLFVSEPPPSGKRFSLKEVGWTGSWTTVIQPSEPRECLLLVVFLELAP